MEEWAKQEDLRCQSTKCRKKKKKHYGQFICLNSSWFVLMTKQGDGGASRVVCRCDQIANRISQKEGLCWRQFQREDIEVQTGLQWPTSFKCTPPPIFYSFSIVPSYLKSIKKLMYLLDESPHDWIVSENSCWDPESTLLTWVFLKMNQVDKLVIMVSKSEDRGIVVWGWRWEPGKKG